MEQPNLNYIHDQPKIEELKANAESLHRAGIIPLLTYKSLEKKIIEKFEPKMPKNNLAETFDKRMDEFKKSLYPLTQYSKNPNGKYPAEMVKSFFEYWTEPNKSRSKMRWELERTWDTNLRLATWGRNTDKKHFKEAHSAFPDKYDPTFEKKLDDVKCQEYHRYLNSIGWQYCQVKNGVGFIWQKVKS